MRCWHFRRGLRSLILGLFFGYLSGPYLAPDINLRATAVRRYALSITALPTLAES